MDRSSASESTGLLARETPLSGVSLAGIEHKTPPLTATADPLDDALHRGGAVSLMESPNRGAAAAPHYQSAADTRSLLSVGTGAGGGSGGGGAAHGDAHSTAGSLTAPLQQHHHSVHVMGGGVEVNVDDIANPNADPNALLSLGPTFDDAAGRAAHELAGAHDERCCGCCRCDAGRFLSHCWFCVACLSFVLLSSLPRLLTVADGIVTLVLYTASHVRDSYPDPDAPDPHAPVPRSVGQFLAYDFAHFSFDKSAADVVLIGLIRMVILFWVYAYRFHTHPYTLKTSALVMVCSTVYNAAKLGTNAHAALHVVLWYAFGITIVEYVLFILIRRRRIRAPEGVAQQFGFASAPSPATSLISASERGERERGVTSGARGTGARTGVTPSSLLAAAQRYTRLDGDDDSVTTPMKSGQTPSYARVPVTANDYAALPPIGETQPQSAAAAAQRVQVRGAGAGAGAGANPNASGAVGTPSSGLHASANAKAVPPSAIPDGTDPSALADPDSHFLVLDGLRVHYKLFRYVPPPGAAAAGAGAERRRSVSSAAADGSDAAAVAAAATSAALAVDSSGVAGAKDDSAVGINRSVAPTTPSAAAAKAKLTQSAGRYASTGSGGGGGGSSDKKKQLNPQQRTSSGGDGDAAAAATAAAQPVPLPTRIEVPIVLLHGFGGSTFTWRRVWRTLCANATCVLAFDRPGFGLTSRPLSSDGRKWTEPAADPNPSRAAAATAALDPTPTAVTNALLSSPLFGELMTAQSCSLNPYSHEYSVWLLFRVMSELGIRDAILVGHSTGGGLALRAAAVSAAASAKAAAAAADALLSGDAKAQAAAAALDRVRAVCCISPSVYSGGFPDLVRSMFRTSLGKGIVQQLVRSELGEVAIRRAWHDPSRIPEEVGLNYKRLSRVLHWHEALVEMASVDDRKSARLSKLLGHVRAPVCILHGEDDRLVACSESAKTISRLTATTADLVLWPNGGHVPHEEYPDVFLAQLFAFLRRWEPYAFSTAAAAAATAAANAAANAAAAAAAKYNTR